MCICKEGAYSVVGRRDVHSINRSLRDIGLDQG
jgi:hypothetical protein